jgi:uncharacterized protein (TIGR03067 family)
MVRAVLAGALLGGVMAAGAPRLKDPPPLPCPDGRWAVERYEVNGQVRDARAMAGYVIIHSRTTATLELNGGEVGTERVIWAEARAGAGQMDFTSDRWAGVKRGIWKLDGDTLTECESAPGGDRPTEYTAPAGSGRTLWVLKRVKD